MTTRRLSVHITYPVLLTVFILGGCSLAYNSIDEILSGDQSQELVKGYQDLACRNCMHNRLDWSSCVACFSGNHGSLAPYYATYAKRSSSDSSIFPSLSDYSSDDSSSNGLQLEEMSKRRPGGISSFLICRCCMSLRNYRCCSSCGFEAFYGIHGKRSSPPPTNQMTQKRNYETSFLDMRHGNGYCSCCEPSRFDFVCCLTQCSKRRK